MAFAFPMFLRPALGTALHPFLNEFPRGSFGWEVGWGRGGLRCSADGRRPWMTKMVQRVYGLSALYLSDRLK